MFSQTDSIGTTKLLKTGVVVILKTTKFKYIMLKEYRVQKAQIFPVLL